MILNTMDSQYDIIFSHIISYIILISYLLSAIVLVYVCLIKKDAFVYKIIKGPYY